MAALMISQRTIERTNQRAIARAIHFLSFKAFRVEDSMHFHRFEVFRDSIHFHGFEVFRVANSIHVHGPVQKAVYISMALNVSVSKASIS